MKSKPGHIKNAVPCPMCQGVGTIPRVVQNQNYNDMCFHCHGHGYVVGGSKDETCFPHEMKKVANLGNCYNRYCCTKCGKQEDIDSSD